MGTQAMSGPRSRKATSDERPSTTPETGGVRPPLVTLTRVAPMVPAPGMPPTRPEARLPSALADELAVGVVAAAGQGVEHHAGLEGVDGEQHREGEGGDEDEPEQARDPRQGRERTWPAACARSEPAAWSGPMTRGLPSSVPQPGPNAARAK